MSLTLFRTGIIAVVMMVLAAAAFFTVGTKLPSWSHFISAAAIIIFALPSFWAARRWLGWHDAAVVFGTLGTFALLVESVGVMTGIPYGSFEYSDHLGYKLFGLVPWTVALAWTPLLLGAYSIGEKLTRFRGSRMIVVGCALVAFDLVLDPGAVRLGFWKYENGGSYYGVPMSNYAGWLISALAGAGLMEFLVSRFKPLLPVPVQLASSSVLILFFWTCVTARAGLIVPAIIGGLILAGLSIFWYTHYFAFDDMIVMVDDNNNPIGTARKLDAHDSATRLHRAFSVFLFNRKGELLLQQRAFSKKTWPGVWSNSCCGHVMLHESVEHAARRRLKYELGLNSVDLAMMLPEFRYRAEKDSVVENEICPVLVGMIAKTPHPNASEVAGIKWIRWSDFLESVSKPDPDISPWALEEALLMEECERFRQWFDRES